tara:strand:- start:316 stop:669 length:354 start_codon:yes stop_codon:yes gene_type:complete
MRYTLVLIFILLSIGYSQTVNGIPISEIDTEYIQIVGTEGLIKKKVSIEIDYGQNEQGKFFQKRKNLVIKDENDEELKFNSMIGALNFMHKYGYDFVNAYAVSTGNQNVYHYLLKKK